MRWENTGSIAQPSVALLCIVNWSRMDKKLWKKSISACRRSPQISLSLSPLVQCNGDVYSDVAGNRKLKIGNTNYAETNENTCFSYHKYHRTLQLWWWWWQVHIATPCLRKSQEFWAISPPLPYTPYQYPSIVPNPTYACKRNFIRFCFSVYNHD